QISRRHEQPAATPPRPRTRPPSEPARNPVKTGKSPSHPPPRPPQQATPATPPPAPVQNFPRMRPDPPENGLGQTGRGFRGSLTHDHGRPVLELSADTRRAMPDSSMRSTRANSAGSAPYGSGMSAPPSPATAPKSRILWSASS